jgi:hypothetical protein
MIEGDPVPGGDTGPTSAAPTSAGGALRAAREAQGLGLDDISARTRVPVRHLEAIEAGDYRALPSPTYAVGFSRAYARAVGLNDATVAGQVRAEVARIGPRQPEYMPYEVADPTRVPSRGLTVAALGLALALLILGGLWFASARFANGGSTTGSGASDAVVASVPAAPTPAAPPAPTGGQVSLTATDEVWLRVYDADDKTLFIGNMKAGDRFDVPATAREPKINVGRPDKLAVTLNGSAVPALGDGSRPIKDVPVSGAAIAERLKGAPAPGPGASPTPLAAFATGAGVAAPLAAAAVATSASRVQVSRDVPPARPRRALTETQRANLAMAAGLRAQQATRRRRRDR